jgi:hypothetical protein
VPAEPIIRIALCERGETTYDVRIEGSDALIGSASHCHVRVSPDKVAKEQLRLEVRDGALFVELRAQKPSVSLNGVHFSGGRLPERAVLQIGRLELRATLEGTAPAAAATGAGRPRPLLLAIGALGLLALGLLVIPTGDRGDSDRPEPPALFSDQAEPCPEREPGAARAAALEFERIAGAKRERAPFLPEEGLSAVRTYWRAGSCWQQSGDASSAANARTRGDALRKLVERDYHLHQVRVYRAQRSSDSELLAVEARVLASYVKGRSDRYVDWLDQLQRELEAQTNRRNQP